MLEETTDPYHNTGYRNITIQKVANVSRPYYLAVLATTTINSQQKRKLYSIKKYGFDEAIRLAVQQLYLWHDMETPKDVMEGFDLRKARKWVEAHALEKQIDTNTGFESTRLVKNDKFIYVVSTWRDPATKKQKTKYVNLRDYAYPEALQMAVTARCEGLGQPVIRVGGGDLQKGLEWLENIDGSFVIK